ncbi:MAG: type 2 isopentenyl-diphosphate Delta-isomerase [Candidatus Thermoplasmatota archaeon]|nr:type 2 isopentenyl-diphosphate Delta-isomerase [Candidatus Thermoplasmatota archaeon]
MIEKRKNEHVKICLEKNVQASKNYWKDVRLIHNALPEIDKDEINLSTKFFGKKLDAPIIIAGITGGFQGAKKINQNLAEAASILGIGFGIGSQRAGIENKSLSETYSVVKKYDIPFVIGNIGAPQLVKQKNKKSLSIKEIKETIDMIDADCLAVHLNFLQEIVQGDGDTNAKGCIDAIEKIKKLIKTPVILKETGSGISFELARKIKKMNIGVDVGGLGGTSFASVEYYRAKNKTQKRIGKTFWDWGIPTPTSILNCKKAGIKNIIGTGGIRTGADGAKAITIGADCFGIAYPLLKPAMKNAKNVVEELKIFIEELKSAMFLVGAKNIRELKNKTVVLDSAVVW